MKPLGTTDIIKKLRKELNESRKKNLSLGRSKGGLNKQNAKLKEDIKILLNNDKINYTYCDAIKTKLKTCKKNAVNFARSYEKEKVNHFELVEKMRIKSEKREKELNKLMENFNETYDIKTRVEERIYKFNNSGFFGRLKFLFKKI